MTKKLNLIPVFSVSLLSIPLIAMQFTSEVNWSLLDFLVMGMLLLSVGFGIRYVLLKNSSFQKRLVYLSLVLLAFVLIWAELAVGIFGTPFAGS